jgi:hypothetical protein
MRSGKDTAVAEIIKQRGLIKALGIYSAPENQERYDIRRYAFADALKREVNAAALQCGGMEQLFTQREFPNWVQYDPNAPMDDPLCPLGKQRTLLQYWGAEYRRAQDPDYWVRQLANTVELEKPQIALVSDLRFPNEMQFVKQYGETVKVDRRDLPPATHLSETALDNVSDEDWSIILDNNGTLEEFKEGAVTAFDELLCNFPFGHNKVSA